MIGLLRLPKNVQDLVLTNKISMGHARVLSKLDNVDEIEKLANKVVKEELSVRALENIVYNSPSEEHHKLINSKPKQYAYIEEVLKEKLGMKVVVDNHKIHISFADDNELNRFLDELNIKIEG